MNDGQPPVDHRKVSREKMLLKKIQKSPEMKTEWAEIQT
jgi:hypothetical protein